MESEQLQQITQNNSVLIRGIFEIFELFTELEKVNRTTLGKNRADQWKHKCFHKYHEFVIDQESDSYQSFGNREMNTAL